MKILTACLVLALLAVPAFGGPFYCIDFSSYMGCMALCNWCLSDCEGDCWPWGSCGCENIYQGCTEDCAYEFQCGADVQGPTDSLTFPGLEVAGALGL